MSWTKGERWPAEHSLHRDRATGAWVHQLTSHASTNHATYFLQSSFTPDGRTMLFVSNRRGAWQLFAVTDFPTGEIIELTDGGSIHPFSPAFHPAGDRVFFVRGTSIWWLRLDTLAEGCVVDFGTGSMGECSFDASGEWMVAALRKDGQSGLAVGRTDGTGWHRIPFPRTVIHPQFHPTEPEWIEFAGDPAPRMHRVRRDGTGLQCLYAHDNEEFVVHETFLGVAGQVIYTVWPRALRVMDWRTREHRTVAGFNAWHITPNRAGTAVLCDTNHPDEGIFLVDVATGERRLVCLSESSNGGSQWRRSRYGLSEDFAAAQSGTPRGRALSWMEVGTDTVYGPQWTHPHPSFSRDERSVVFTSDRTGHAQVYVAEIPFA
ncbi:MAG: oligogalacturonate lyase family protein [Acidobacteria bacterium]|nr:oligogalacturonate lyase family protein [Acidobacteriota bacterium]